MATSQTEFSLGDRLAAADMTGKQFLAVKITSGGKFAVAGDGEAGLGILQDDPLANKAGNIMIHGISKAVIGAAVAEGDSLQSNASGKLITKTTGVEIAVALEAGSAASVIISVLLR
jgi:hypothetical protein